MPSTPIPFAAIAVLALCAIVATKAQSEGGFFYPAFRASDACNAAGIRGRNAADRLTDTVSIHRSNERPPPDGRRTHHPQRAPHTPRSGGQAVGGRC